jgi:cell division protease FtsH
MDGFETINSVILLAATNRPDVLDKALLRPGRFDRQIIVDVPGVNGREAILKIHSKGIPMDKTVNLKILAKGTPGLVGADLENLVNEAAILAARKNKSKVSMSDFEDAKDKVMMGAERRSMVLTPHEKKVTAYHESGHALVAYYTEGADPVHKITIIPRGLALGITAQLPEDEKHNYQKKYLLGRLDILMGGRCAEKLIFDDTSTGAGNDISVATDTARRMVCEWGMSGRIGPLTFGKKSEEVFLGREISHSRDYSGEVSRIIDEEITNFVKNAEKNADKILLDNIESLHAVANALLEYESISGDEMNSVINGESIVRVEPKVAPKRTRRSKKVSKESKEETSSIDDSAPISNISAY